VSTVGRRSVAAQPRRRRSVPRLHLPEPRAGAQRLPADLRSRPARIRAPLGASAVCGPWARSALLRLGASLRPAAGRARAPFGARAAFGPVRSAVPRRIRPLGTSGVLTESSRGFLLLWPRHEARLLFFVESLARAPAPHTPRQCALRLLLHG